MINIPIADGRLKNGIDRGKCTGQNKRGGGDLQKNHIGLGHWRRKFSTLRQLKCHKKSVLQFLAGWGRR